MYSKFLKRVYEYILILLFLKCELSVTNEATCSKVDESNYCDGLKLPTTDGNKGKCMVK